MYPITLPTHAISMHSTLSKNISRIYFLIKYLTQSNNECDVFIPCLKYNIYNKLIHLSVSFGYPPLFPKDTDPPHTYYLSASNAKFVVIDSIDHIGTPATSSSSSNYRDSNTHYDFVDVDLQYNVIYINSTIYINHLQINTFKYATIKTLYKMQNNGEVSPIISNMVYMLNYVTNHIFNKIPRTHLKYILNNSQLIVCNYNGTQFKLTKRLNIKYNQADNIRIKENLHLCSMN